MRFVISRSEPFVAKLVMMSGFVRSVTTARAGVAKSRFAKIAVLWRKWKKSLATTATLNYATTAETAGSVASAVTRNLFASLARVQIVVPCAPSAPR